MAKSVILYEAAAQAIVANGNTADLDTSQVSELDIDINVSAVNAGTVQFVLEEKQLNGQYDALWSPAAAGVAQQHTDIGPGLTVPRMVGDLVRLRWILAGGANAVTADISIHGKQTARY